MINSDQLSFTRTSGTRNTFFITHVQSGLWKDLYPKLIKEEKQNLTRKLCGSFHGFKTDGLLFLYDHKDYDFAWDFFNSDGSFAEMCGNAARCASLYYWKKIKSQKNIHFFTGAGDIDAEVISDGIIKVTMSKISEPVKKTVLGIEGLFLDTGVPHFVIEKTADRELAKKLRQVNDFGASGANITFVEDLKSDSLKAVTFERGVEDYTQACGTGAVASAMYYQAQKNISDDILIHMPGGDLQVQNAKAGTRPLLTGPAQIEFEIIIDKEMITGKIL